MNSLNPNIKSKTKELKTEIIKEIKEIKKEEIKKEEIKNNDLELDFSSSDDDLSPKKSRSPSPSPIFKKKLIIKKQKKSIKKEKGKSYSLDETIGDDVMEIY